MSRKFVPEPGMLYIEPVQSSLLSVNPSNAVDSVLVVVRCGGDEVNDMGVSKPMRFKDGEKVYLTPGKYQRTPRGFLAHQDAVAAKVVDWDGEDELTPRQVMRAITEDDAKLVLAEGRA